MDQSVSRQSVVERWLKHHISQTQFIAYGFFIIIMVGTLLLMLPVSNRDGQAGGFLDCLFTATSATCVTGLVVADTWTNWSLLGQVILLVLIQIGGLGFISVGIFVSIILRREIDLRTRGLMEESINTLQIGGMVNLAKRILIGTAFFESVGALLLAIRFIPRFGLPRGLWYSVFHSVSAFCNAGFDLMGNTEAYSSLCAYAGDGLVILTVSALIIIGGIGFIVWDDLCIRRFQYKRWKLHTKLVIVTTALLLAVGTFLFWLMERHNLMEGMNAWEAFLASFFSAVTPRTAGFNSIDTGSLTDGSKFLTVVLMTIGGSPGSTAGGIKTTTMAVLLLCIRANVRQSHGVEVFGKRLEAETLRQAATILMINLSLVISASIAIMAVQGLPLSDVLFETASAMGTAGMSTGVTRSLNSFSRVIIVLLMYSGRIGSLSFALAFTRSRRKPLVMLPVERITIG